LAASDPTDADLGPSILAARACAHRLYDGVSTPHRSCGIAIAETFGRATAPYQALRRGGITGHGECGAIVAGRLVLGELLGDPDPTGPVTPALREAMDRYDAAWRARIDTLSEVAEVRPDGPLSRDITCARLTGVFPIFRSPERHAMCTSLATEAATAVAEALVYVGAPVPVGSDRPEAPEGSELAW
jgi:hypothetical protein